MSDNPIIPHNPTDNHLTPQQRGGLAVVAKYGRDYMAQIGKRGFQTTVRRHFNGDREAACSWLAAKGQATIDSTYARWGFQYFQDPGPHPAHLKIKCIQI